MRFLPKIINLGKLKVVLVPEDRESVTVRVMLGTGSREETDKEAGSAHFLEHFVFKGTKKFPGMHDINEVVENVGGAFNAYTGQNEMGFWVKMAKGHIEKAMSIVGQVVTEPLLPPEHFDKERGTILEELYMYEDRPNHKAAEECNKLLFGKTNMGRAIIGTVESLKAMTVDDLRNYFEKWFVAENIVVGVVGAIESEERVLELIRKEFAKFIDDTRKLPEKNKFVWEKSGKIKKTLVSRKLDQAAMVMAFPGLDMFDERRHALELLNIILGDGMTSRLFKEIREEKGWAYAIGSDVGMSTDNGEVLIGAGLPKAKLNEAFGLIKEICLGIGDEKSSWAIKEEELKTAKDCFKGRLALGLDKPENVLGRALEDITFRGKLETVEEVLEAVDRVSLLEVHEIAKELFGEDRMSVAVVGDYKKLPF